MTNHSIKAIVISLFVILIGCSHGSNPLEPANDHSASKCQTVILGAFNMTWNPQTQEKDASAVRGMQGEFYGGSGVHVTVNFCEYDGNFYHLRGDPSSIMQIPPAGSGWKPSGNDPDNNDGIVFTVKADNTNTSQDYYDPRILIEVSNDYYSSSGDTKDTPPFPFRERKLTVVNADDYIDSEYDKTGGFSFANYDPLIWITESGDPHTPSSRVLYHKTPTQEHAVEAPVFIKAIDSYYRPIQWTVKVVAETDASERPTRPYILNTPWEQSEEAPIFVAQQNALLPISLDLADGSGAPWNGTHPNCKVYADMGGLDGLVDYVPGQPPWVLTPNGKTCMPFTWNGTFSRWEATCQCHQDLPSADNVLYLPIYVQDDADSNFTDIADIYPIAVQGTGTGEPNTNGHYLMSYISHDDDLGSENIYLMDTYTGQSRRLSSTPAGNALTYNSISEDGQVVAWTATDYNGAHIWESFPTPHTFDLPPTPSGTGVLHPELSTTDPGGIRYIAWHENMYSDTRAVVRVEQQTGGGSVAVRSWNDIMSSGGSSNSLQSWFPALSDNIQVYPGGPSDYPPVLVSARLLMFPMRGIPPTYIGHNAETSRIGWVLVNTASGPGTLTTIKCGPTILPSPPFPNPGTYRPYTDLNDLVQYPGHNVLEGQNFISRISIAKDIIRTGYGYHDFHPPSTDIYYNWGTDKFLITFESDEDGFKRAFTSSFYLTTLSIHTHSETGDTYESRNCGAFWDNSDLIPDPDDVKDIGPRIAIENQRQYFASSNRNQDGVVLSMLRAGSDDKIDTWMSLQMPGDPNAHTVNLGSIFDMSQGEQDIPSMSQGDFQWDTANACHYPAVAFDSHHFSTGDIYLIQMQSYKENPNFPESGPPFWVKATVKRLTQNGESIWPRLSEWIPTQ